MQIVRDMHVALGLARSMSPVDTGNVRYNAIQAQTTNDGFVIKYSLSDAFYIYFLEEGTKYSTKHKGFIGARTVPLIAEYLYSKYTDRDIGMVAKFEGQARLGNQDFAKKLGIEDFWNVMLDRQERQFQSQLLSRQWTSAPTMASVYGWQAGRQVVQTQGVSLPNLIASTEVPNKFWERM